MTPIARAAVCSLPVLEALHLEIETTALPSVAPRPAHRRAPTSSRRRARRSACPDSRSCRSAGPRGGRRQARWPALAAASAPAASPASALGTALQEDEARPLAPRLGDDEHRQAPVTLGAVRVGAGQQHQHVGTGCERAPGLDPVDDPSAAFRPRRRRRDVRDVRAVVGLGDRDRDHELAGGDRAAEDRASGPRCHL